MNWRRSRASAISYAASRGVRAKGGLSYGMWMADMVESSDVRRREESVIGRGGGSGGILIESGGCRFEVRLPSEAEEDDRRHRIEGVLRSTPVYPVDHPERGWRER